MVDTKLILIEGLTGAGKSTTAQRLWLHLERCGHAAEWFFEDDTAHPLWPLTEQIEMVEAGALNPSCAPDTVLARWRNFAAERAEIRVVTVLESALTMVGSMLMMNFAAQTIVEHVLTVEQTVAKLKPVLIYLRQRDIPQALRAVCDDRRIGDFDYAAWLIEQLDMTPYGKANGLTDFAGLVRFYEHWRDTMELLVSAVRIPRAVIELSSGDWAARERQLTEFVGLPEMREVATRIDHPSRFLGRYQDVNSENEVVVAGNEQGLYIEGLRPTRLILKQDGNFYVAAMCAELSFSKECGGVFHRLDLRGSLPNLSPVWTRVEGGADARAVL